MLPTERPAAFTNLIASGKHRATAVDEVVLALCLFARTRTLQLEPPGPLTRWNRLIERSQNA